MKKEKSIIVFVVAFLFFSSYITFGARWAGPKETFPQENTLTPIDVGTVGKQNRSGTINFAIPNAEVGSKIILGVNDLLGSSLDNSFISFLNDSPIFSSPKPLYILAPSVVLPNIIGDVLAPIGTLAFDSNTKTLKINVDGGETGWNNVGEQGDVWKKDEANGIKYDEGNVVVGTSEKIGNLTINGSLTATKSKEAKRFIYFPAHSLTRIQIPRQLLKFDISDHVSDESYSMNPDFHTFYFTLETASLNYDPALATDRLGCDRDDTVFDCLDQTTVSQDPSSPQFFYDVAYISSSSAAKVGFPLYGYIKMKYEKFPDAYYYETTDGPWENNPSNPVMYYLRQCSDNLNGGQCPIIPEHEKTMGSRIAAPPPESGWPEKVFSIIQNTSRKYVGIDIRYFVRVPQKSQNSAFPGGGISFPARTSLTTKYSFVNSVKSHGMLPVTKTVDIGNYSFCALGDIQTGINYASYSPYCEVFYDAGSNLWKMKYSVDGDGLIVCRPNCF